MKKLDLVSILVLFFSLISCGKDNSATKPTEKDSLTWQQITSVEDLYAAYPGRIKLVFENLDLKREGLEKVEEVYRSGDTLSAAKNLVDYYKNSATANRVSETLPAVSDETVPAADSIVQDIITIQGVSDQVPRLWDGHLKWEYTGPADDMEYAWLHNRHTTVNTLLKAWLDTGNPKYARHIDYYIKDWIISSWPYPAEKSSTAMWRGLEVTGRVRNWMPAFYNLIKTNYISPATQLLILSSLPEHAHYLRNYHGRANWLTMEMSGLATIAAYWPEFKKSSNWLTYSVSTMVESMKKQVYPDGVQTELTSHYHQVALQNFSQFADICALANVSLPDFYTATLEDMWNYLASTMRPDGNGLLNNDSDLDYNRKVIMEASSVYDRKDWQYIASNGRLGARSGNGPSFAFPWAGQLISRSSYRSDAHWSFFDIGPWGTGHQHNDKLHLSVSAFGRDLLVDAGRFAYQGKVADRFGEYARSSDSHNTVLIDGQGQGHGIRRADSPLSENSYQIEDQFDYASASFGNFIDLDGEARHRRSLFYLRGKFWIVVDRIETDRPRKVETLWHWHPDNSIQEKNNGVVASDNQRGNLKIIPVDDISWDIEFIKGQDEPAVQGWYSSEYNTYESNVATIYSSRIQSDHTFIWILFPSEKVAPAIRADILSQDSDAVKIRVSIPGKRSWDVTVPFSKSGKASLEGTVDE